METVVIIQMLSQLLPTVINILMHYEELVKNGSEQDKEKMKAYLDTLKWKSWDELAKEAVNPVITEPIVEPKKEVANAPAPANTDTANTAAAN